MCVCIKSGRTSIFRGLFVRCTCIMHSDRAICSSALCFHSFVYTTNAIVKCLKSTYPKDGGCITVWGWCLKHFFLIIAGFFLFFLLLISFLVCICRHYHNWGFRHFVVVVFVQKLNSFLFFFHFQSCCTRLLYFDLFYRLSNIKWTLWRKKSALYLWNKRTWTVSSMKNWTRDSFADMDYRSPRYKLSFKHTMHQT